MSAEAQESSTRWGCAVASRPPTAHAIELAFQMLGLRPCSYEEAETVGATLAIVEVGADRWREFTLHLAEHFPGAPVVAWCTTLDRDKVEDAFAAGASALVAADEATAINELARTGESVLRREPGSPFDEFLHLTSALSRREREVLSHIAQGMDNLQIAAHLGIGERTVKTHVTSLYRKLAQENRTQLALLGARLMARAGR